MDNALQKNIISQDYLIISFNRIFRLLHVNNNIDIEKKLGI